MDLTVTAIPFYFGSMAAEKMYLDRQPDEAFAGEPGAPTRAKFAGITKEDTVASLAMGVGSLVVPIVTHTVASQFVPGKGRWGKKVLAIAAGAAIATTAADIVARKTADPPNAEASAEPTATREKRRRIRSWARKVAKVGSVATVATGGIALTSAATHYTNPWKMWQKGQERDLGTGVVPWTIAIVGWDFIYYWNHRFMHEVRALWAIHVVHHSSEKYNLSTALRQPVADVLGVFIPYGLMARVGVRPNLIAQARAINLLYQYWIHTETIGTLGPAEEVLNTASHHRVHHGSNPQYLDRNHGSILITWDRLFGTFEREAEPVVYGLTKNIENFNPAVIATHEHRDMLRDVADSENWRDRLSFMLRGPGWAYARHAERALTAEPSPEPLPA